MTENLNTAPPAESGSHQWIYAAIAAVAAVVSAIFAATTYVSNERANAERTHKLLSDDLFLLSELERASSESIAQAYRGCGGADCVDAPCTAENCLGHLALAKAYRDQYQLVTAEAVQRALQVPDRTTTVQWFQIAGALYLSGDVQASRKYALKAMGLSKSFTIQFRGRLLLAQIAFFQRDLETGNNYIREAVELADQSSAHTSIERNLFKVEARLVCGNMHAALGERREAKACLEHAYTELSDLPRTSLVDELEQAIVTQLTLILYAEEGSDRMSFEELEEKLKGIISSDDELKPPVAVGPEA